MRMSTQVKNPQHERKVASASTTINRPVAHAKKGASLSQLQDCNVCQESWDTSCDIYAVDELQNPLPRRTMLFEGDTNSTGGRNDV